MTEYLRFKFVCIKAEIKNCINDKYHIIISLLAHFSDEKNKLPIFISIWIEVVQEF